MIGPLTVPLTTTCDTLISPSMRACSLTTSVPASPLAVVTLPLHDTVDAQPAGEADIAFDRGPGADQAVDALLRRRVLLPIEHGVS